MNKPIAFISSTIYDLQAERNIVSKTLEIKGFETYMSEYGNKFPIEPFAIDTYDSCIRKVKECNLFVLILGKRFGSSKKFNWKDTIIYKEFEAAIDPSLGIPIYIFLNKEVDNLRKAYKNDESKGKQCFLKIHSDIDIRIFEFLDKFSNLIDNSGNKQKNYWYFPVDNLNNLEEVLNYQIDNLLLRALRVFSASSRLNNSPYIITPYEIKKIENNTFLKILFLNKGPSDIYNVKIELYCTIKSDLQYWHLVPKIGLETAPYMEAFNDNWYWTFDLSNLIIDPQRKRIPNEFKQKLTDIITGKRTSFESNYLLKDGAKIGKVKIEKKNIGFILIYSFTELLSGKLRVEKQSISLDKLQKLKISATNNV